ncbi:MAG: copper resistance protein NlpE N-terminal domain-containing protein [Lunatimonas sp.]|uniref:copper resistance protein NlpE N-terminal domain-containing protein n=1 Tax=Lunatimonas sp. TaxID=2060141 RepID=UPI00263ABDB4|nr:copper resistance protein NlpE N-terminal domain-containing protein [Lunatimonas sp.]MCC5935655.1 copper resistance protein NlpE N-terminal domain-containing protein [Lunatimonas sp.]
MKRIVFVIGIVGILYSCGNSERSGNALERAEEAVVEKIAPKWVVYEGTVPCIDCEAIHMELWLERDETEVTPDYRMIMNYENTPVGDKEEEVTGNYTIVSGYAQDRDAVVYQLNPGTNEPRHFVLNEDRSITMLGENMQRLEEEDDLGYRLERKESE